MSCKHCRNDALYKCIACGAAICEEHSKFRTVCPSCMKEKTPEYRIHEVKATAERDSIRELVKRFWGEQEQLAHGREFKVAELPAYVAEAVGQVVGFASFASLKDAVVIVALGVLPRYQGAGIGRKLIQEVESETRRLGRKKLLVSTSNDDLPALAFYQSLGFQIYRVKPNAIAKKHGGILKGIGGLPVRDEIRLQKTLQ